MKIFIIGPMKKCDDGVAPTTSTATLKHAVQSIIEDDALTDVHVEAPDDLDDAMITRSVFSRIDSADLVIADLSEVEVEGRTTPSPNVYYEIAFADALGLRTVLVARSDTPVPFYFTQSRINDCGQGSVDEIVAALRNIIVSCAKGELADDLTDNPLRTFYGAPVVDISAAAGLAIGYYQNFVYPLIKNGGALERSRRAQKLLVVVPDTFSNHRQDSELLCKSIVALDNGVPQKAQLKPQGATRPFPVILVGDLAIDIPSTLYSLYHSPRLDRLRTEGASRDRIVVMETVLRDTFRQVLDRRIDHDNDTHKERVRVIESTALESALERFSAGSAAQE